MMEPGDSDCSSAIEMSTTTVAVATTTTTTAMTLKTSATDHLAETDGTDGTGELTEVPHTEHPMLELNSKSLNIFLTGAIHHILEYSDPTSLQIVKVLAESGSGFHLVCVSLVINIPLEHTGGPSCITRVLRSCPLPSKEDTSQVATGLLNLCRSGNDPEKFCRNTSVVIGCLADLVGGQQSNTLLSSDVLDFLVSQLSISVHSKIILYALNALEKLAQSGENKTRILQALESTVENPLLKLEKWVDSENYEEREVGFCAQWLLDNIFLINNRPFGYEGVNDRNVTVILNSNDVTPYLKLSPDGLEARCDVPSFESVRSTFRVDTGTWYYEVLIVSDGLMQIGWATKNTAYLNMDGGGLGIGDDEFSVGFDGHRKLLWHCEETEQIEMPRWKPGDIVGTLLDLNALEITFYLNGEAVASHKAVFDHAKTGFFAAASFSIFQQCQFNFGSRPFSFPPVGKEFKNFNDQIVLDSTENCKVILPRHLRMKEFLRTESVRENVCNICIDNISDTKFLPCEHTGVCSSCSKQLNICPFCRESIAEKVKIIESLEDFHSTYL